MTGILPASVRGGGIYIVSGGIAPGIVRNSLDIPGAALWADTGVQHGAQSPFTVDAQRDEIGDDEPADSHLRASTTGRAAESQAGKATPPPGPIFWPAG